MNWTHLFIASFFEVIFAVSLKYTDGYSKPIPSLITTVFGIASFLNLSKALQTIPVGVAYSIWASIGIVGSTIVGALLFNEGLDGKRIFFIAVIVAGIVGLHSTVKT